MDPKDLYLKLLDYAKKHKEKIVVYVSYSLDDNTFSCGDLTYKFVSDNDNFWEIIKYLFPLAQETLIWKNKFDTKSKCIEYLLNNKQNLVRKYIKLKAFE